MKVLLVWGHKPRPWGYEVRVDLQDDAGQIHNEVLTFPLGEKGEPPAKDAVAKAVDNRITQIQAAQAAQAEEDAQAPIRQALEAKEKFMAAVAGGLIDADAVTVELTPYVKPKLPVLEEKI